jgi:hypothetical protein
MDILYILIGIISGISIGIIGIGGGVILMPLLVATGASLRTAVATSLALQLVPQSLPGLWIYHKNGHVNWRIAIYTIIGSLIGITSGAYLVNYDYINEILMYRIFFCVLIFSTIYIGRYHIM